MDSLWLDRNWKKLLWMANFAFGGAVIVLSIVDIYGPRIDGIVTLLRTLEFFLIGATGFAIYAQHAIDRVLFAKALKHPFVHAVINNDVNTAREWLNKDNSLANYKMGTGENMLGGAARFGNVELVKLLLLAGADPLAGSTNYSPLFEAARSGQKDVYDAIREKVNANGLAAICKTTGFSELAFACYEGDLEKVRKLATRGNVAYKFIDGIGPLHMAVLGARSREVVGLLVEMGVDINALAEIQLRRGGSDVVEPQHFSALALSVFAKDIDVVLFLYDRDPNMHSAPQEKDPVMLACELGLDKFAEVCLHTYNWKRVDRSGKTALDYAKQSGHQKILNKVNQYLAAPTAATPVPQRQAAAQNFKKIEVGHEDIEVKASLSLSGLVGLDGIVENFSIELANFLKSSPGESRGLVLWGDASVGKTEFGQRLAGLRAGENKPGLEIDGVEVRYVPCCNGSVDIAKEVADASPKSVIIFDEIDKFFNPKSGIVDESQAKKLRSSIITNFQNKPLFWVFMGTFHDVRGNNNLTERELSSVLGTELTSRIDFADWRLPSWTVESLMAAAEESCGQDDQVIQYSDDALMLLVSQALQSGGGVRQFKQYHYSFMRDATRKKGLHQVEKQDVEAFLQRLNAA